MSESAIDWTGSVWNPVVGCSVLSLGCTACAVAIGRRRPTRRGGGGYHRRVRDDMSAAGTR